MKFWTAVSALCLLLFPVVSHAGTSVGVGVNYWHALEDIDLSDFDQNGVSWYLSLQSRSDFLVGWEVDLEMMPKGFMAAPQTVYAPQAYAVIGKMITGAVGIGWYYSDGDWSDEPFYALRAGLELMLLPSLTLDITANYRFTDWGELEGEDIDTDTIMLGAALMLGF